LQTRVARLAISIPFGQRLSVSIVRESDRRSFEITKRGQTFDGYDVGSIGDLFR